MKTILYNPIFINPQAYYVFPRLTRYLQPDNESTAEPANYIGTIEVKVIAYGDTTLKRTYTNTDSIYLSEFKNTWIRISLFTKVGSCVLGEWKIGNMESDLPYIDPEVLASLKAVVIVGNKTNNDSDRAIVKNLVDPDNPFVISNAAYDKMSSYGGYEFAKFDNTLDWYNTEGNDSVVVVSRNGHSITLKRLTGPNFWYFQNSTFRGLISNVIPFKVNSNKNISVIWDVHGLSISEGKDKSVRVQELVLNPNEDNYTNLKTLNEEELAQIDISTNSLYYLLWFDLSTLAVDEEVTIEMLPLFEGAFVTDGVDDMITSTKTVQEMLGGSNEITVVSMAHFIKGESNAPEICRINQIRRDTRSIRNSISKIGKSGIFGYTYKNGVTTINNILGDKNDCTAEGNLDGIVAPFSVEGYYYNNNSNPLELCSIAWYWTIIANKVLTTDQINQVIAYFNLDRTLKPDILCNTIKQGITNENHAEFGDKLIDFSGNGRDIQLNNIAWKGDSGIGKYNYTYNDRIKTYNQCQANGYNTLINPARQAVNGDLSFTISGSYKETVFVEIGEEAADGKFAFTKYSNGTFTHKMKDTTQYVWFRLHNISTDVNIGELTVEFIPSHAGALCLDGVNDFGKVTGMPVYKDYTFIIDRQIIFIGDTAGIVASKSEDSTDVNKQGAFLFEYLGAPNNVSTWSFYKDNGKVANTDFTRSISYQSKYSYNGKELTVGTSKDSNKLWLGTIRDRDSRFFNGAIYSLMSFPYSMSEFLIERQLKKHKLGTLYPDMVEFRPVIKSSVELASKPTFVIRGTSTLLNTGDYIPENSEIWVVITMNNAADRITKFVINGNTIDIPSSAYNPSTMKYGFPFTIDSKSPQKINITIYQPPEYLTMLSNSTLISNETLIKNE